MTGTLYGIGVGPGDPGLLTIKAQQILQQVDVLCVPRSAGDRDSLALQVVQRALNRQFNILELDFPMSKDRQILEQAWQKAAGQVVERLRQGLDLAFVTIGDPLFYSTFSYLATRVRDLCPGVEIKTVPGVMAMAGCAAAIGLPLAEGEETLLVIPAAYGVDQLREA
ncbi:MAG: precorrin-2 C(20)-methyltransferase, partial [Bacillota bacterium]